MSFTKRYLEQIQDDEQEPEYNDLFDYEQMLYEQAKLQQSDNNNSTKEKGSTLS